jgi:hypothetical protein
VEVVSTWFAKWIWREELMVKALEIWALEIIEEALGADAERVLPLGLRLTDLHVGLPRHQVAMPEVLPSAIGRSARLWRRSWMAWAVGGFAEALAWPDAEASAPRC